MVPNSTAPSLPSIKPPGSQNFHAGGMWRGQGNPDSRTNWIDGKRLRRPLGFHRRAPMTIPLSVLPPPSLPKTKSFLSALISIAIEPELPPWCLAKTREKGGVCEFFHRAPRRVASWNPASSHILQRIELVGRPQRWAQRQTSPTSKFSRIALSPSKLSGEVKVRPARRPSSSPAFQRRPCAPSRCVPHAGPPPAFTNIVRAAGDYQEHSLTLPAIQRGHLHRALRQAARERIYCHD